ncbi:MAG: hypothetical protein NT118_08525 [Lentisphaerae bacterium]|nr:hypothetical protein [Lentisphaerota bacterium]
MEKLLKQKKFIGAGGGHAYIFFGCLLNKEDGSVTTLPEIYVWDPQSLDIVKKRWVTIPSFMIIPEKE